GRINDTCHITPKRSDANGANSQALSSFAAGRDAAKTASVSLASGGDEAPEVGSTPLGFARGADGIMAAGRGAAGSGCCPAPSRLGPSEARFRVEVAWLVAGAAAGLALAEARGPELNANVAGS